MPNDWFQFKQFKIEQDLCAMKVSTDACIQGAWAAHFLRKNETATSILDIGTGTGLLALMIAQLNPQSSIEAVELNENAFIQAKGNFAASPWSQNLRVHHNGLQEFTAAVSSPTFDFIICNPPFFHNHLQSQQKDRNNARHSVSLSKQELAAAVCLLLKEDGMCCVMYPKSEWEDWLKTCREKGLQPLDVLFVKPSERSETNRVIGIFSKKNNQPFHSETLVIYEENKMYTPAFQTLLQPYYLAL